MSTRQTTTLYPGITFHGISDDRFKTNKLSVHMIVPLQKDQVSVHALIPSLLRKGHDQLKDFTAFHRYLEELYGAEVMFGVEKAGDCQILSLSVMGIDDRYTLQGEKITIQLAKVLFQLLLHPPFEQGEFSKKEIALEAAVLVDAIESQINDKRLYAIHQAMQLMCQQEPYGLNELGTVEQAKELTTQQVTKAYQDLLQTARMEVIFVGCGDFGICEKIATQQLKIISRCPGNQMETHTKTHQSLNQTISYVDRMEVTQSKMVLGLSTGLAPVDKEMFALRMMCMVLGGSPTAKLFVHVREKLSLCYYCAASMERSKGIVRIDCGVENNKIQQAKQEIIHQIAQIQQGHISMEEYQDAQRSLINALQTVGDSLNGLESYYLANILYATNETPEDAIKKFKEVTIEDIVRVSQTLKLDIVYLLTNHQYDDNNGQKDEELWEKR